MDDTDPFRDAVPLGEAFTTYTYQPRDVECRVCFALIHPGHITEHLAWHRTLTNQPKEPDDNRPA